eukprot:366331-Chlamydomonas_euryale.AAC.17
MSNGIAHSTKKALQPTLTPAAPAPHAAHVSHDSTPTPHVVTTKLFPTALHPTSPSTRPPAPYRDD